MSAWDVNEASSRRCLAREQVKMLFDVRAESVVACRRGSWLRATRCSEGIHSEVFVY